MVVNTGWGGIGAGDGYGATTGGCWWLGRAVRTRGVGCLILDRYALVAQGIEHFSPKEGVGRSNRLGGTQNR